MLAKAHPGRVHAQDGGNAVVAGVVEELLPAIEGHVGIIVAADDWAGIVHLNKLLGGGDGLLGWDIGVFERALAVPCQLAGPLLSVFSVASEIRLAAPPHLRKKRRNDDGKLLTM